MAEQKYLSIDIVTLDSTLYSGKVKQVSAPTLTGEITVLANHIPLITSLEAGELKLKVDEGQGIYDPEYIYIAISSGFLEVKPNSEVNILVDSAMRIDAIDEKKALEAKGKAEQVLHEYRSGKQHLSDQEFAGAAGQLAKALAQIKVARRKKKSF